MIELVGLRKRFGPLEVLRGLDLTIARGRVTSILGPNGSGKTTLIKVLLGLVHPDAGRIAWNNEVLNGDGRYRSRIGYMPQIVRFPANLTGHELLTLVTGLRGSPTVDESIIEALHLAGELGKPVRTMSGGTRQKLNAALAFRFQPELLILDEPTAGLDPISARALKARIRAERDRGRTILLTSHVLAELEQLTDDIAFLVEGTAHYRGTLAALKEGTGEDDLEGAIARLMLRESAS
jgi:Cu-processing system ATP-binding protein